MGQGAYLPGVEEEIVRTVEAQILTPSRAISVEAVRGFVDVFGTRRAAGQQWLVTAAMTEAYLLGPHEKFIRDVHLTVLGPSQFCVVVDPWRDGRHLLGQREVPPNRCRSVPDPSA